MFRVKDTYIAHVLIAKIKSSFRTLSRFVVISYLGVSWKNYKVWNKHGEHDENLPKEVSWDTVCVPMRDTIHKTVREIIDETKNEAGQENMNKTINEACHHTLVDPDVVDALDKMISDP